MEQRRLLFLCAFRNLSANCISRCNLSCFYFATSYLGENYDVSKHSNLDSFNDNDFSSFQN